MNSSIPIFFLLSFFFFAGCQNCDGCTTCEYENFSSEFSIGSIKLAKDSNFSIIFTNLKTENHKIELMYSYVKASIKGFDVNMMNDKNLSYIISGEHITTGTCAPYRGLKVRLNNKTQVMRKTHP